MQGPQHGRAKWNLGQDAVNVDTSDALGCKFSKKDILEEEVTIDEELRWIFNDRYTMKQDATVCQMLTTMSVQIIVFCIVSIFSLSSLANFSKMKQSLVPMINENVKKLLMMLYRINADTLRFQYTWRGFLFTCPCRSWTWNKPKYVSNS